MRISSVCYHYIKREDGFSRIWGHDFIIFKKHIDFYSKNYSCLLVDSVNGDENLNSVLFITFDDGLKEHLTIAKFLYKKGILAHFSIPTCIFEDEPTMSQVLHFGTAYYGIKRFYKFVYSIISSDFRRFVDFLDIDYKEKKCLDSLLGLKEFFNKKIPYEYQRDIKMRLYENTLKKDFPNFIKIVYLNKQDVENISKMGHKIVNHTTSHCPLSNIGNLRNIKKEIFVSNEVLSCIVGKTVDIFSYPFGSEKDLINTEHFFKEQFNYIFTTFRGSNDYNKKFIGRYCSQSIDTVDILKNNMWYYEICSNNKR